MRYLTKFESASGDVKEQEIKDVTRIEFSLAAQNIEAITPNETCVIVVEGLEVHVLQGQNAIFVKQHSNPFNFKYSVRFKTEKPITLMVETFDDKIQKIC